MPPQIPDDEDASETSDVELPSKPKGSRKVKSKAEVEEEENLRVESDDNEDDDEEPGEDEYVVERITNHLVDEETGALLFQIKWEGFEKKSDRTWEPEENLSVTADKILTAYLAQHGGKKAILEAWKEKKQAKSSKKRARASTDTMAENGAKRGRKSNGTHPATTSPPRGATFKPPPGNWEDEVVQIDACEGANGDVVVYLTWKGGHKSQHPLAQVYKRCPQKMLRFYESHLVFKKTDDTEAN